MSVFPFNMDTVVMFIISKSNLLPEAREVCALGCVRVLTLSFFKKNKIYLGGHLGGW